MKWKQKASNYLVIEGQYRVLGLRDSGSATICLWSHIMKLSILQFSHLQTDIIYLLHKDTENINSPWNPWEKGFKCNLMLLRKLEFKHPVLSPTQTVLTSLSSQLVEILQSPSHEMNCISTIPFVGEDNKNTDSFHSIYVLFTLSPNPHGNLKCNPNKVILVTEKWKSGDPFTKMSSRRWNFKKS